MDAGGSLLFGEGQLYSSIEPGAFPDYAPNKYSLSEGVGLDLRFAGERLIDTTSAPLQATVDFECSMLDYLDPLLSFIFPSGVNAGASLTFTGPDGTTMSLSDNHGIYSAAGPWISATAPSDLPATMFPAGSWALTAPGGLDVGPFGFDSALPPPIRWTNRDQLDTVDRSADLTITWDTSGLRWDDIITVSVKSERAPSSFVRRTTEARCRAIALAGQVTIPSALLQGVAAGSLALRKPELKVELSRRSDFSTVFPLTPAGGGIAGAGLFTYSRSETRFIQFRVGK